MANNPNITEITLSGESACGCCEVLCPLPSIEVKSKHFSSGVCGHIKKLGNGNIALPVTVWRDRKEGESYNHSWVDNDRNYTKNYTFEKINQIVEILAQNCSYQITYTGNGTTTRNFTFQRTGVLKFEGCGNAPSSHDLTLNNNSIWSYSINNAVPQKVVHTFNKDVESPEYEDFDCGSYTVNKWNGNLAVDNTNLTQELGVNPFRTFKYKADLYGADNQGAATETLTFSSQITWPVVEAAIDMGSVNEVNTASTDQAYSELEKTGITHDNVLYPDAPSSIVQHTARFRFKIPSTHEGTWFSIKYELILVPSDGSASISQGEQTVEWTGAGNQNDPNADSWFTTWVDVPENSLGKVEVKLLAYRCYHSGKWQKF